MSAASGQRNHWRDDEAGGRDHVPSETVAGAPTQSSPLTVGSTHDTSGVVTAAVAALTALNGARAASVTVSCARTYLPAAVGGIVSSAPAAPGRSAQPAADVVQACQRSANAMSLSGSATRAVSTCPVIARPSTLTLTRGSRTGSVGAEI